MEMVKLTMVYDEKSGFYAVYASSENVEKVMLGKYRHKAGAAEFIYRMSLFFDISEE